MDKKIRSVFTVCIITIIVFSVWSLVRSHRPSHGTTYERLSAEEASEYMSFEPVYCVVDVRDVSDYQKGHVISAVNLPEQEIVERAEEVIGDRGMMIYVYGYNSENSCAASQKLSDMGFTSVTETGSYEDWKALKKQVDQQAL